MTRTAGQYDAQYIQFGQGWFLHKLSEKNKGGVCKALVLRWLKSSHKHGFFTNKRHGLLNNEDKMSFIDEKQTYLMLDKGRDQDRVDLFVKGNRTIGGFGSRGLSRVGDVEVASNVLGTILSYSLRPYTANTFWNTEPGHGTTLSLDWGGDDEHMVGAANTAKGFMFFDPNGGVMTFNNRDDFFKWFHEQFFKDEEYQAYRKGEFVYYKIG